MSFLCWGLQSWTQDSRWGLTRVEQRGRITSLNLLAMLLLMQPRIWLAFWAASTQCRLVSGFSSTSTPPSPSPQSCSQSVLCPASICAWNCPSPWGGPCTWPCQTSQACPASSEWHPFLQRVNHSTQLGVIRKLAEGSLNPTVHVADKDVKQAPVPIPTPEEYHSSLVCTWSLSC